MATKKSYVRKGAQLKYNAAIERRYANQLRALVGTMTASVRKELLDLFKATGVTDNFAVIGGISSQTRILLNKLDRQWERKFNDIAKNMSPRMMRDTLRESKAASARSLKQLYETKQIKVSENSEEMKNVFTASVNQSVDLIRTIPQEYFARIKGETMRSITNGGSLSDLIKEIKRYDRHTIHRAENIALDQTRKAYSGFNRTMCAQSGVTHGIWIHTGGTSEPRKRHRDFNGKEFSLSKGAPVGTMKGGPNYVQPAEEPFCLPGSARINEAEGINNLIRRTYDGYICTIRTSSGTSLEITPNHPVLTGRGWVVAGEVKIGDYVINAHKGGGNIINGNLNNREATIYDLFHSFRSALLECAGICGFSRANLKANISNSDINAIDINGFLPNGIDATSAKRFIYSLLTNTNDSGPLVSCGSQDALFYDAIAPFCPSNSLMRRMCKIFSLIRGEFGHADETSLASIAKVNAALEKSEIDCSAWDIELFGQGQHAFSGFIEAADFAIWQIMSAFYYAFGPLDNKACFPDSLREIIGVNAEMLPAAIEGGTISQHFDCVIDNRISNFSGHVYNLENKLNWYTGNGLIVHNCRCTFIPILNFNDND